MPFQQKTNQTESRLTATSGSVLGVFGGGQLGRMFAQAANRLGYRVHVFAPDSDPPAAQVAAQHTCAAYEDLDAVCQFAHSVRAVTYEFENIPPDTVRAAAEIVSVRPDPAILAITRNRLKEKGFLHEHGIPVTPFARAVSLGQARDIIQSWKINAGLGVVLKTTELGYDGKGQVPVPTADALPSAWESLGNPHEVIVEQKIDLAEECSMLVARDSTGRTEFYGPFYNSHRNHILDITTWTAEDSSAVAVDARAISRATAEAFDLQGMMCIEYFIARDGAIMVNEIAPRPHNSGHLTIEACTVSQFAQQTLLTAGQPAAPPEPRVPAAAMANLLGNLWANGEPNWSALNNANDVTLHLYGKKEARPGRKMGHLTALAATAAEAKEKVHRARATIARPINERAL